ncbi:MAG: HYR domain-containing protein [Verrucomicrobia bacterium]|nr:HYR domain-containing protein [Verrucomicrobiota bacterium]
MKSAKRYPANQPPPSVLCGKATSALTLAGLGALLWMAAPLCAVAGANSYDSFSGYTAGALAGQPYQGTGYGPGSWSALAGTVNVSSGSTLNYISGLLRLRAAGGKTTTPASGSNGVIADLDTSAGGAFGALGLIDGGLVGGPNAGGVLYLSFLGRNNSGDVPDGTEDFAAVELYNGAAEVLGVGNNYPAWAYGTFGIGGDGDLIRPSDGTWQDMDNNVHFFIVKMVFVAGGTDTVTIWMDPDLTTGESGQANTVRRRTVTGNAAFNRVAIRSGSNNNDNGWDFDEVRFGAAWEDVTPTVPAVRVPPVDQNASCGGSASFSVVGVGTPPLSYQWLFENNPISGATGTNLTVSPTYGANAGNYSVAISNDYGMVTSAVAVLAVTNAAPPVIVCPGNIVGSAGSTNGMIMKFLPTVTSTCGAATFQCTPPPNSLFPPGTNVVQCVATDAAGSTSSCSFEVAVFICEGIQTSVNAIVPDNAPSGVVSTANVASPIGRIHDLNVTFTISNGWNGDLYAYLVHQSGFAVLLNRVGRDVAQIFGYGDSGFQVVLDDQAISGDIHLYRIALFGDGTHPVDGPVTGTWQPDARLANPLSVTNGDPRTAFLSVFQNLDPNGQWTFFVADLASGDTSTLVSWGLEICGLTAEPFFVTPPASRTNEVGSTAQFSVVAGGSRPMFYQWYFDGNSLPNQTNDTLTIAPVQWSNAGPYTVLLSNAHGTAMSPAATLTVVDTTGPVLTCPAAASVQCLSNLPPTDFAGGSVTDVGDPNPTVFWSGDTQTGACPILVTRTYGAYDIYGNTNFCTQTITVQDTVPPVITCVPNKSVECTATWSFDPPSASDNCSAATITVVSSVTNAGPCGLTGSATRTWRATDDCGNASECSQTVTIVDTTPPVLVSTDKTVECGTAWTFDTPAASDACGQVFLAVLNTVTNAGPCGSTFTARRTWRGGDACGNSTTTTQTVTVIDTTAPVASCPPNKTIECGTPWDFDAPAATDACGSVTAVPVVTDYFSNYCGISFLASRVWNVTDACGNFTICLQTVRIVDTTAPVIHTPADLTVQCIGDVPPPNFAGGSVTDCDPAVVVVWAGDVTNGTLVKTITRTYSATDACTNASTAIQTITVRDSTPPVVSIANIIAPADLGTCSKTGVTWTATISDNCDLAPTITCTPSSGSTFALGTTTVNCAARDLSSNTNNYTFTVTIVDAQPPAITCSTNIVVSTPSFSGAIVAFTTTASDLCSSASVSCTPPSGSLFPVGTNVVLCQATDLAANVSSCVFDVVVVGAFCDSTNFVVNAAVPDNNPNGLASVRNVTSLIGRISDLNVDLVISNGWNGDLYAYLVHQSGVSILLNRVGRTAVAVFGYDDSGFEVTLDDQALNGDIHLYRVRLFGDPNQQIGGPLTNYWQPDGRLADPASVTETNARTALLSAFNGLDPNGEWTLFVADSAPGDVSTLVSWGLEFCGVTAPPQILTQPSSSTNALGTPAAFNIEVTGSQPMFYQWYFNSNLLAGANGPSLSFNPVTWTDAGSYFVIVTNPFGGVTSVVATLTVVDTEPPVIVCPPSLAVQCDSQVPPADFAGGTYSDSQDPNPVLVWEGDVTNGLCPKVIMRTYAASDSGNNVNRCVQTIVVFDNIAPTITCGPNQTLECGAAWTWATPTADDNCAATVSVASTVTNWACGSTYTATRTWLATDLCGNTAACSQSVTVQDTQPPLLACAANKTVECGSLWFFDIPTATDSCETEYRVYDNSANDLMTRFDPGASEVGNEIILAGTNQFLREFGFEYWGTNMAGGSSFSGPVTVRLRFYLNDGAPFNGYPGPGTLIYDSGAFPIEPTSRNVLLYNEYDLGGGAVVPLTNTIPDSFTWTVQFSGMGAQDSVGVDLFSPPVVGQTYSDFWVREGSSWIIRTNAATDMGFGAVAVSSRGFVTLEALSTVTNAGTCGGTLTATRTWKATDLCGNSSTCTQTVTAVDVTPPTVACPPDKFVECGDNWSFDMPMATDNCGTVVVSNAFTQLDTNFLGRIILANQVWYVYDQCGNYTPCVQRVFILDTLPPVLVCPSNLTLQCLAQVPPPNFAGGSALDACEGPVTAVWAGDVTNGTTTKFISRTYQATDSIGNVGHCVQTITVQDTTPPTVVCPANLVLNADLGQCSKSDVTFTVTTTDNCSTPALVCVPASGTTFPVGTNVVVCTATDSGGLTASCSFRVTVVDITPPALVCAPNKTVEFTAPWLFDAPAVTDECTGSTVVYDNTRNDLAVRFDPGTNEVGNEIILAAPVGSLDEFSFEFWGTNTTGAAVFGGPVTVRLRFCANDGTPFNGYPTPGTVLYDSGDIAINPTPRSVLSFGVSDFVTGVVPLTSTALSRFTWTVQFKGLGANDHAGVDLYSPPVVGTTYTDYWERTPSGWQLKVNPQGPMSFGSEAQGTQGITVVYDNSRNDLGVRFDPGTNEVGNEILLAAPVTYLNEFSFEYWGTNSSGSALFQGPVTVRLRFYANDGAAFNGYPTPGTVLYDSGDIPINPTSRSVLSFGIGDFFTGVVPLTGAVPTNFTWTVQFKGLGLNDHAGVDLYSPPVVGNTYTDYWERTPTGWQIKTNPQSEMAFGSEAQGTPRWNVSLTVVSTVTNVQSAITYTATRTWRATDNYGNASTCSQTVTVVDATPPVITCPQAVTVQCDANVPPRNFAGGTVSDIGDPNPTVIWVRDVTNGVCPKTITRTYAAYDFSHNTNTCTQTITVQDTIAPTITSCPTNQTYSLGAAWTFGTPTASDNCGLAAITVVSTLTNYACGGAFTATRTWAATDPCGNSVQCSQSVTTFDVAPPTLVCVPTKTVEAGSGWSFDPPSVFDFSVANVVVYDNSTHDLSSRFDPGTSEVGNEIYLAGTARRLQDFSFEYWGTNLTGAADFDGPVTVRLRFYANDGVPFNGYPTPGTLLYDSGDAAIVPTSRAVLLYGYNDLMGGLVPLTTAVPNNFTWTVQFSGLGANDRAGVDLYSPPTIGVTFTDYWQRQPAGWQLFTNAVPADFGSQAVASQGYVNLFVTSTVTNSLGCGATMSVTRTWLAVDGCGNSNSCSQTVQVVDTTPPAMVCAADKVVECGMPWSFSVPTVSDTSLSSVLVYDNSVNDLAIRFNPGTNEIGNEIVLADTARYLQNFSFEYWGTNVTGAPAFQGPVQVRLRFYANDGPAFNGYPTPGTLLYDSGPVSITLTPRSVLSFSYLDFVSGVVPLTGALPDRFTWTVQFSGLGANDLVGVDLYSPPVIGTTYTDYWERTPSGWQLKVSPTGPVDIGSLVHASVDSSFVLVSPVLTNYDYGCTGLRAAHKVWMATDVCGNRSFCIQNVYFQDTTPPTIACPSDAIVQCDGAIPPPNPGAVVATDLCSTNATVIWAGDVTNGTVVKTITRTYRATDACGNVAECSQNITVQDSGLPTITCPGNFTVNVDAGDCFATVNLGAPLVGDNCGIISVQNDAPPTLPAGTNRVTWTAIDVHSNVVTCVQTVIVREVLRPVVTSQPQSTTNLVGSTVTFTFTAASCTTPKLQWFFNSNSLPGATNFTLVIPNAQLSQAGFYHAFISNTVGRATSAVARLTMNRAPVAVNDTANTTLNRPFSAPALKLTLNDSDPDGDPITMIAVGPTSTNGGTVTLAGGVVTYTPLASFIGVDRFSYTISDNRGATATGTVVVTVTSGLTQNQVTVTPTTNGWVVLRFAGIPGRTYEFQRSPFVFPLNWVTFAVALAPPNGVMEVTDTNAPPGGALYRTRAP